MRSAYVIIALLLWAARVQATPDPESPTAIAPANAASSSTLTWSANYPRRILEAIRPHIVWTENEPGSPVARIEVRTSPDGTIVQVKVLRSSGVESWDQAVQTALAKVGRIPLDVNGQVPPVLVMLFRPQEGVNGG